MIFFIATKAQRHEVSRRKNLREPWCPGVFVAKDILTTKAQRHEVAQRKILVNLGALVPSWHFLCLATKAQRHKETQRETLSEPLCLSVFVANNLATKSFEKVYFYSSIFRNAPKSKFFSQLLNSLAENPFSLLIS